MLCLQSGAYPPRDAAVAEAALKKGLPAGAFSVVSDERAGVWMLFMGRFIDDDARRRKEAELKRHNTPYEETDAPPEFARGLSLGRFASRAEADRAQAELNKAGVRTARIVSFTPPQVWKSFRIEKADSLVADKARSLGLSMPFVACGG